ncbi:MAG: dihydroorotate dehydrogenase electron transfer subunit [Oscillospiraceae bacterium]|jgi:dihydroorotate dehydrogenase electron transfer subunit|nr:dihydroorotate dehydrogenase electron transfer subunit [Oscillospiraceae bacterium]
MRAVVMSNKRLAKDVFDLRVALGSETRPGAPGSFYHIACGGERLLRRPISVCGAWDDVVRFVYAVRGEGTKWLSGVCSGARLDMLGPLGRGFDLADEPTLLVGGGIGVPPMVFCAERIDAPVHAILGFRDADAVILTGAFASFDLLTDDGSAGDKGYPHEKLRERLAGGEWKNVLACGPRPMLKAVAKVCAEFGVRCQVSMEERMACGVGACLVCACAVGGTYKRVCADGPVFNAEEVDWDV